MTLLSKPHSLSLPPPRPASAPTDQRNGSIKPPREHIFSKARPLTIPSGHSLMRRDEADRRLILIERGDTEVIVGDELDELVVGDLGAGDVVGGATWLGWLPAHRATVRARGTCVVRVLGPDSLASLRSQRDPGLTEIEAETLRGLLAHMETARVHLSQRLRTVRAYVERGQLGVQAGPLSTDNPESTLSNRGPSPGPSPGAGAGAGAGANVAQLLRHLLTSNDLSISRCVVGKDLPRYAGDGRPPRAWLLLSGGLVRMTTSPAGTPIAFGTAASGELGGFYEALGYDDIAVNTLATEDTTVVLFPAARCQQAMHRSDPLSNLMRTAMAQAVVVRLAHTLALNRTVAAMSDLAISRTDIDQLLMLRATALGLAGAI